MQLMTIRNGDWYYIGPSKEAMALARKNRKMHVSATETGATVVELYELDMSGVAEWGCDADLQVALRFALGAFLGPIDDEYTEDDLRKDLGLTKDIK